MRHPRGPAAPFREPTTIGSKDDGQWNVKEPASTVPETTTASTTCYDHYRRRAQQPPRIVPTVLLGREHVDGHLSFAGYIPLPPLSCIYRISTPCYPVRERVYVPDVYHFLPFLPLQFPRFWRLVQPGQHSARLEEEQNLLFRWRLWSLYATGKTLPPPSSSRYRIGCCQATIERFNAGYPGWQETRVFCVQ